MPPLSSPYGTIQDRLEQLSRGRVAVYNHLFHRLSDYYGHGTFTQTDLRFSIPNAKTGAFSFSLPASLTCPGQTPECAHRCYAMKGNFNTNSSRMYWGNYLILLENGDDVSMRALLYDMVIRALPRQRGYFRLHVAGDFFSQHYLNAWQGVAQMTPSIKYWSYTRSFMLDFTRRPKNFTVYASADVDNLDEALDFSDHQETKVAYMGQKAALSSPYRSFQCPGPGQLNRVQNCVECGLCTNNRGIDLWFASH